MHELANLHRIIDIKFRTNVYFVTDRCQEAATTTEEDVVIGREKDGAAATREQ